MQSKTSMPCCMLMAFLQHMRLFSSLWKPVQQLLVGFSERHEAIANAHMPHAKCYCVSALYVRAIVQFSLHR